MDYKKLGLALVFTVVAIFNFLKNPLFIIGSWGTLLLSLAAIFAYLRAFKVEPSAKVLKQVWKGEFDFKITFWVFYVLIGTILTIPLYLAEIYYDSIGEILALFSLLYILVFYAYIIFAIVGSWRASSKYIQLKKKKKDSAFWGYAAKVYVVLNALNAVREIILIFIS